MNVPAHLFVYGTLMRGLEHHGVLLKLHAKFVGDGTVRGRLYACTYPALVLEANGPRVRGETYRLPSPAKALDALDAFEEEGTMYRRDVASVSLARGRTLTGFVYTYLLSVRNCRAIPHGDFRRYASG